MQSREPVAIFGIPGSSTAAFPLRLGLQLWKTPPYLPRKEDKVSHSRQPREDGGGQAEPWVPEPDPPVHGDAVNEVAHQRGANTGRCMAHPVCCEVAIVSLCLEPQVKWAKERSQEDLGNPNPILVGVGPISVDDHPLQDTKPTNEPAEYAGAPR